MPTSSNRTLMRHADPHMKKSLFTIQRLMIVFGLVITGLLAFLGFETYSSMNEIRIGSPSYVRIVGGKDLIADILPPPLYPAEPFAYAHIIENFPEMIPKLADRLDTIENDYRTRMAYWKEQCPRARPHAGGGMGEIQRRGGKAQRQLSGHR